MAIKLEKNKGISLKKADKGIGYIRVGLGWDAKIVVKERVEKRALFGLMSTGKYEIRERQIDKDVDIDASIFLYNSNKNPVGECSYRNKTVTMNGRTLIRHSGDNRTGSAKGDDETIEVFLEEMLNTPVHYAYVVLNVFSPEIDFEAIRNAYVNIYDKAGTKLAEYNLTDDYTHKNGVIAAKLVKHIDQSGNKSWEFVALGDGLDNAERLDKIINRAINY